MPAVRYPLAQAFMSRDGSRGAKDAFVQNAVMEAYQDRVYVRKRPGTALYADFGTGTNPQGTFFYNGLLYAAYNNILYRTSGSAQAGTDGAQFQLQPMPSWYGRGEHRVVVFQDRLWVIGGAGATYAYADVSSSSDGRTWTVESNGAFGNRLDPGVVVHRNKLWVIGGVNQGSFKQDVWSSEDGVNWKQEVNSAPWTARSDFGCIATNAGILIMGGATAGGNVNDMWFSPDGVIWTQVLPQTTHWTARRAFGCVYFNGQVYVIGGLATDGVVNDVWTTGDYGASWIELTGAAFASGRWGFGCCVYQNQMWVLAGQTAVGARADVYRSSNGVSWTLVTASPGFDPRFYTQAVAFKSPSTVSPYRYETLWLLGGLTFTLPAERQEVWMATLNTSISSTYSLPSLLSGSTVSFATYQNGAKLLVKDLASFWVLESGTLAKVTDSSYPAETVPGIVAMNSFAYVMTPEGVIRACKLDDPLHWPSLQFTTADYSEDRGMAIAKHLNFLVAFGETTIQLFYDAGNQAPGTPLSPYPSANAKVGLAHVETLCAINNTLMWVGQTVERNWGVYVMDGVVPRKISNSWVDRAINRNFGNQTQAFVTSAEGHSIYVLVLNWATGSALAYDMEAKQWYPWVTAKGDFPYGRAVSTLDADGDLWFGFGRLGGKVYAASYLANDDDGTPYVLMVQTDKIDAGSLARKFWGRAEVVGDRSDAYVTVEVSDDDYQTWTKWGEVSMADARPYLNRGGSARRRAFRVSQADSNPARWEALDLTVTAGD